MTFPKLDAIVATGRVLLDEAETLLTQKEPARAIGYGSAAVIVVVVAIANALGFTKFGTNIDFGTALGLAGTGIVALTGIVEGIRHYVYAPQTVDQMFGHTNAGGQ